MSDATNQAWPVISQERGVNVKQAAAQYNKAFLTTFLHRHMYSIAVVFALGATVAAGYFLGF